MKSLILAASVALALVGLAPPAGAVPVRETCAASGDPLQACDGGVLTWAFADGLQTRTEGWNVAFTLDPDDNCGPIIMTMRAVPNAGPITTIGSAKLSPGGTTPHWEILNAGGKGASVELHATGVQGGCNTGTLTAWSGDLSIETIQSPA